ncbi:TRAP transporter fused permease subunit [Martelella mediterranea]|uniref:TRAP transporter permease n=1 Tax=Martelella mediterranea TaxID=293089 RepID=UPI001E28261F|nr:TRAP transporter fused permease subunit [Martelella mediterranea]MCD1632351.1 TRAP transporter fused permease subunit [Martelella mediterranea]
MTNRSELQPEFPKSDGDAPAVVADPLTRALRVVGMALAALIALNTIYVAYAGQVVGLELLRAGSLFVCAAIVIFTTPLSENLRVSARPAVYSLWAVDFLLLANLAYACFNFLNKIYDMENLVAIFSPVDRGTALVAVLTLIELTRRTFGGVLASVGLVTLAYCLFGANLPWIFHHSGFSLEMTMEILWFGVQGIFGDPVGIVILLIFIFIVFGALLEGTGAGEVMIRMALAATARTRGGPAHAAIIASGVFGMSSGSVVANVVGTGVVTIPLIKKRGFKGNFAGAVEAAASTGGQLMPPVMGAAAFLMVSLVGVPYRTICIAALIPALLYYANLFLAVVLESRRLGLEPTPKEQRRKIERRDWVQSLMFFIPISAIAITLGIGFSPSMAGFWAVVTAVISGFVFNKALRQRPWRLVEALARGGAAGARIMMAVGTIGVLIGVFNLTGLGLKFATQIALLGDHSLFIALVLAALSCLILGMGMPTLPAYLIIVLVLGVGIRKLGVPDLSIHLFVFYFGVLSAVTPPVALAAVAAAPIAGAEPVRTGINALKLSLVGFIVPFMFIYEPTILLVVSDFHLPEFLWAMGRLCFAIWLLATGFIGFGITPLPFWSRVLRPLAGIAVITTYPEFQLAGIAAGIALTSLEFIGARKPAGAP